MIRPALFSKAFKIILICIIIGCSFSCNLINRDKQIAIQPFQGFEMHLADTVKKSLENYYGYKVIVLPPIKVPSFAFINVKSPRYRADSLLKYLKSIRPDSIDHIIGLTHFDISITKRDRSGKVKEPFYKYHDYGIFGLGARPGKACIVSSYRLKNAKSRVQYIDRLKKVSLHEIAHNLGLKHCSDKNCVVTDANESIRTIDHVKMNLCDRCVRKIYLMP